VPSVEDTAPDQSPRKPRVLPVTFVAANRCRGTQSVDYSLEPATAPWFPPAHFARIRTWMRYGMTIAEVAAVYGLAVDELARTLRNA
jgi:hypothetical protein